MRKGWVKFWEKKSHPSDEYFKHKLKERMGRDAYRIVYEAYSIRHQFPDLSGPQLVRLVYWGC